MQRTPWYLISEKKNRPLENTSTKFVWSTILETQNRTPCSNSSRSKALLGSASQLLQFAVLVSAGVPWRSCQITYALTNRSSKPSQNRYRMAAWHAFVAVSIPAQRLKRRHSQRQHTNTHLTPNLSTHKYQRKESLKLLIKMAPSWLGGSGRLPPCVEMIMTLVVAPSAAADRRRGPVKRRPSGWWAEVWLFRLMGLSNTRCKPIVKNLCAVQTSCLSCPLLN